MRQGCRCDDRRVSDLYMVVQLIALFQTTQDRNGIFNAWLSNKHFLETTLQRSIFFNILTILIERGCADTVQLTARQSRFQHVAGIHCAVRFPRPDHSVQFINKQNDVAFLFCQIVQHPFQALFELTAILGPGHQRPHIQRQNPTTLQPFRYFTVDNTLCQSFNDGGFTNAGLTN